jgi:hypothetical protein
MPQSHNFLTSSAVHILSVGAKDFLLKLLLIINFSANKNQ